jgi:hypothetical protein
VLLVQRMVQVRLWPQAAFDGFFEANVTEA